MSGESVGGMTDGEWAAFAVELEHVFRGDFGPRHADDATGAAQEGAYRLHLGSVPYDVAAAAIALLLERGQVWLPKVGELRAAIAAVERPPAVPFVEAFAIFRRAYGRHAVHPDVASPAQRRAADVAIIEDVQRVAGEGAARWVHARGPLALAMEPTGGEHGGAVLHRLEREYDACVERAREDRRRGVALERARRVAALGSGGDGPRRLDAARAVLPPGASS